MNTSRYKHIVIVSTKLKEHTIIKSIITKSDGNVFFSKTFHLYICMLLQKKSLASIKKIIANIALLYEYYYQKSKESAINHQFLESFILDLRLKKEIYFESYSDLTILKIQYQVKQFVEWIVLNPKIDCPEELSFIQNTTKSYNFLKQINNAKFFAKWTNKEQQLINYKTPISRSFPVDKVLDLINSFDNPRDKLIIIFLAFGGRRLSEVLHLFNEDIQIAPGLKITIGHPELSLIENESRIDYLSRFNRIPRTKMTGSQHLGFQGIRFENPKEYSTDIFLIGSIEKYVIQLHKEYLKIRASTNNHPYYFVSKNGLPLCDTTFHSILKRHCKMIGISSQELLSNKKGHTTYSLRHFYGYYTSQALKLDKVIVQRLMGLTDIKYVDQYHVNNDKKFIQIDSMKNKKVING